ncbi:MAG: sensor histidine kinase [Candidatus Aminicenantia bacterium]
MERIEEILLNEIRYLLYSAREGFNTLSLLPELTLSIIHKINNKMTPLLGYTQLLMNNPSVEIQQKLKIIYSSGSTASSILNSFFEYLKSLPYPRRKIELASFLREVIDEEKEKLKGIDFRLTVEEGIEIPINKFLIKEAFKKILENSFEAMNKPEKRAEIKILKEDEKVFIEFWDNGEGIEGDILPNIFEPFFTTKEGRVGLGLSFVHGVVKNHGGEVLANSQKGEWTKIILSLPISPFGWREERVLLLAPENEFYRLLFELSKEQSIKIEWRKSAQDFDWENYTHIIIDEEVEDREFIKTKKLNGKIIFIGSEGVERTIFIKKPASLINIISHIS